MPYLTSFQAVEKDKEIDAITIKNNDEVTQFSRNDFADLAEKRIIDTSDSVDRKSVV